jgi:2-iminobutanoate/2-iminopropanoate deaminase
MARAIRNPSTIHAPLARYSHQIELLAPVRLLVLSGQVGMRPDGALPSSALEQFDVALDNVLRNLEAADLTAADLVKLTFYLTEPIDSGERATLLAARLDGHEPCMTLIVVAGLASPALKVEIDAVASAGAIPASPAIV